MPVNPHALLARLDALEMALQPIYEGIRRLRGEIRESDPAEFPPVPNLAGLVGASLVVPPSNLNAPRDPPNPRWIPIRHTVQRVDSEQIPLDIPPCGGIAHYLTVPPYEHQKASLDQIRICPPGETIWRAPKPGIDAPVCMSCGLLVDPFSNADLDYLSHMRPGQPELVARPVEDRYESFPGHTPRASFDVQQDMQHLMTLAREAGLVEKTANDGV